MTHNNNIMCCPLILRLDAVEMRKWVTSDATHEAHGEAKRLLSGLDKDNVSGD